MYRLYMYVYIYIYICIYVYMYIHTSRPNESSPRGDAPGPERPEPSGGQVP